MQAPSMNKLAAPDCPQCAGDGVVLLPRQVKLSATAERPHPRAVKAGPGFCWVGCAACKGQGKR